jgi:UDP-N-acetylmuramate dehydrogenase
VSDSGSGACLAAELARALPGAVTTDAPIAPYTTYHLGGPVAVLVRAETAAALAVIAGVVRAYAPPVLVVGRGSNLLVADGGFDGLAVVLGSSFEAVELGDAGLVRAGGAVALPVLARQAARAGRGGLEFYVGIPGSVGGAVRMNAGGHGRETAEVLVRARSVDLAGDAVEIERTVAELALGYRSSAIGAAEVVTGADFVVTGAPPDECERAIREIVRWRREHQPGGANAGSVFRNPPGDSAGRLIDALGLKGFRVGGAVVSPKHANFFQAEQGATADDVRRLVVEVRRRVSDATGIVLEPELQMFGFTEAERP